MEANCKTSLRRFIMGGEPVSSTWVNDKKGMYEVKYHSSKINMGSEEVAMQLKCCKSAMIFAGCRLWWQPRDIQEPCAVID